MPKGVYVRTLRPVAARFWEKVDKNGPVQAHMPHLGRCWEWTRCRTDVGYGQINVGAGVKMLTHRLSWLLADRRIPAGKLVLHKCDFRACVRPSHLFVGTYKENTADMIKKGRYKNAPSK